MRKILLISLVAVIVAGGFAMAAYGQDERPKREGPPGGESRRGGPPGPQLDEQQSAKVAEIANGTIGKALKDALKDFQDAVRNALKGSIQDEAQLDRAVRMATFRAIMPPREGGDRRGPGSTERPKRPPE